MANIIELTRLISAMSSATEDTYTKRVKVLTALEDERAIVVVYRNRHGIVSFRAIRPLALKQSKTSGKLYVTAEDVLRNATRNFIVDNIMLIQETL